MAFFNEGMEIQIGADTSEAVDGIDTVMGRLTDLRGAVLGVGGALALLSAGGLAVSVDKAREFQDAMADVEKVTNADTADELAGRFQALGEDIPIAVTELAKLGEQAGKFGAEGPDEIESFVETVGKIQTATDLSAEVAGKRFAKIAGAVGMPLSSIEDLGNGVNELADSMKTDADEITDTATRTGNVLSQRLGLGADEVLSLSAAMNEVSPSSERAAGALQRSAEALLNPSKTEDIAAALGMVPEEFRRMRDENPAELMDRVASTVADGGEQSRALAQALGVRATRGFSKLGDQQEAVEDAQKRVNSQFEEGTSLSREMEIRTETFNGQLQLLKNQLGNVGRSIGDNLLPPLTEALSYISDGVEAFSELNERTDGMLGTVSLLAGLAGGLIAVGGALASMAPVAGAAAGAVGALGTAVGVLLGPVGIALGAVALLAAAWSKNFLGIRDTTSNIISKLRSVLQGFIDFFAPLYAKHLSDIADEFMKTFDVAMKAIRAFVEWATPFAKQYISIYTRLWDMFGDEIKAIVRFAFAAAAGIIKHALRSLRTIIKTGMAILRGDWKGAWDILSSYAAESLEGLISFVGEWGGRLLDKIVSVVKDAGRAAAGALKDAFNGAIPDSIGIPEAEVAGRSIGGGSIELPSLDTGGMIEQGGLARVHAGERVIPAAQVSDRGPQTVKVEQETSASAEVTRRLDDLLDEVRSGGGDVVLQVGERELARVVENSQNDFGASLEVNQ